MNQLKATQRDIITKERQARFATGCGPETPSSELDPNVTLIAPNLMATASTLFSSNMNDDEIENHKQIVQDINDSTIQFEFDQVTNKENIPLCETKASDFKEVIIEEITVGTSKTTKKRKFIETKDDLKIERIRNIIKNNSWPK
ncbi:PREDICTED: uncharacterized protein LOC105148537 [Acromyrmex echinatior]|uniref:uncharacterized protein LOC105148537 n=1 Tax=Acromyrmex echinatior TaxID=103372 RepID=UPI00058100DF|nr:PREDICTED: uncharacterized protein LOC105148537 [Acromyrmex echinatior]